MTSQGNFPPPPEPILVFDWEGTLMQIFPDEKGPMSEWKTVAAIDRAAATLESLGLKYHLILATNTSESNASQVRAALKRVGLDGYITEIFNFQEPGCRKPEPQFFYSIAEVLQVPPARLVMIGDDLQADISGAKGCGWRAAWYNPGFLPATNLHPQHDIEIHHLPELINALREPALPDIAACQQIFLQQKLPLNLLEHVNRVAGAAYLLALALCQAGIKVNPILAHRGGLLHDLARPLAHQLQVNGQGYHDHGELAFQILQSLGYPALAEIALTHPLDTIITDTRCPVTWEQKIVYYADKLVDGDRLVPIEDRLSSLARRYPEITSNLPEYQQALITLQTQICAAAGLSPTALLEKIRYLSTGKL
ncbi:MAG TPA: HAD-IIIA family hydrolase [Anaerolineaceae bacterium]